MKCKDCNSMCKYRSTDAEKECFYSQPQPDNLPSEIKTYNQDGEEKYWENVRIQAAISAMQAIINSDALRNAKIEAAMNVDGSPYEMIALSATLFANSLVKQLKGE